MNPEYYLVIGALGLLVGVAGAAVVYNRRANQRLVAQTGKLAEQLGIELVTPEPKLGGFYPGLPVADGEYRGRRLQCFSVGHGMNNTRQTDTALRVETQGPEQLQITVSGRGLSGKLGQFKRGEDAPTGDKAFDKAFLVRSNNPGAITTFLGPDMRARLRSLWGSESGFIYLRDGVLTYTEFGLLLEDARRARFERMADLLCDLADELEMF